MSSFGRIAATRAASRYEEWSQDDFAQAILGMKGGGGKSIAGPTITDERALGLTAWYSGVRYLTEAVAFLPAKHNREGTAGRRPLPDWLARPDYDMVRQQLLESWMLSFLHRGVICGFKLRDPRTDRVVGMRWVHPDRVKFGVENNRKTFTIKDATTNEEKTWTTRDVFSVLAMSFDGITPVSPIKYHANSLGIVAAGDEYAARFYANGGHFDKYVQTGAAVGKDQLERYKEMIREFATGLEKAHEIPVLSHNSKLETVGLNAEDAQLLSTRQFGVTEIARILRIPPHKLYDLTRSTNNNIEHQSIESVMDSVRPWAQRFELWNEDDDLVVPGNKIKLVLEGLLRGDTAARADWYQKGINAGWMMPSEPRVLEDMPALEGMDVYYRPSSHHIVDARTGEVTIPAGRPTSSTGDS